MRTYHQAVSKIATQAFNECMNGGNGRYSGIDMVSFVFGKTADRITSDVNKKLEEIKNEHYKQCKKD